MQMALAAYRLLVAIASSSGGIGEEEERLLARYHRALGLPEEPLDSEDEDPRGDTALLHETHAWRDASAQQRAHLLRMLARVAYADGDVQRRERRMLERVAERLGISRMEYASIQVAVEDELQRHHRGRARRWIWAGALGVAGVLVAVGVSWAMDLRAGGTANARTGDAAAFKDVEKRGREALVLIQVDYVLRNGARKSRRRSTGTGFFLSDDGLIATNKHVLEPWKFAGEPARLAAEGFRLDPGSVRIVAYPVGARVEDADGRRVTDGAFDTKDATLRVVAMAPDHLEPQKIELAGGRRVTHPLHANDSADLALLQATAAEPVAALALRDASAPVETLEPMLVLGFPDGTGLLERGRANPTVALGEVSKVEDTLLIQAPLLSGSSGGPVLDSGGRVVGVVTRKMGGMTFGRCIRSHHLRELCRAHGVPLDAR